MVTTAAQPHQLILQLSQLGLAIFKPTIMMTMPILILMSWSELLHKTLTMPIQNNAPSKYIRPVAACLTVHIPWILWHVSLILLGTWIFANISAGVITISTERSLPSSHPRPRPHLATRQFNKQMCTFSGGGEFTQIYAAICPGWS